MQVQLPPGTGTRRHTLDGFQHPAADAFIGQHGNQPCAAACGDGFHNATEDAECLVRQVRGKEFAGTADGDGHRVTAGLGQLAHQLKTLAGSGGDARPRANFTPLDLHADQLEGVLGILKNLDEHDCGDGMFALLVAVDMEAEGWGKFIV